MAVKSEIALRIVRKRMTSACSRMRRNRAAYAERPVTRFVEWIYGTPINDSRSSGDHRSEGHADESRHTT